MVIDTVRSMLNDMDVYRDCCVALMELRSHNMCSVIVIHDQMVLPSDTLEFIDMCRPCNTHQTSRRVRSCRVVDPVDLGRAVVAVSGIDENDVDIRHGNMYHVHGTQVTHDEIIERLRKWFPMMETINSDDENDEDGSSPSPDNHNLRRLGVRILASSVSIIDGAVEYILKGKQHQRNINT